MASVPERLTLDGLELNDGNPWTILEDPQFEFRPAPKKLNWVSSPLSDGAVLSGDEDHYENAEMVFAVICATQSSKDAALGIADALTQKLQEARRSGGNMPLVWTPAGSAGSWTFYVEEAEWEDLGLSRSRGWFDNGPSFTMRLTLRSFLYGAETLQKLGWNEPFGFDGLTGGRWRFDAGSGTVAITSGALVPSTTAIKRLYVPFSTVDSTVTMRYRVGSTTSGANAGMILKRLDGSNYLRLAATSGTSLAIHKVVANAFTSLASSSFTQTTSTYYWLQAQIVGNDLSLTAYSSSQNPLETVNPTPLGSVSYTLTGGDATQFGEEVRGNLGIYLTPAGTASEWPISDFIVTDMEDIKSSEPLTEFEIPNVQGHVPAEGRLVVTEGGAKSQAHFEWGLEARDYNRDAGPPLILDSAVLIPSAGSQVTASTKYDPDATGTNAITSSALAKDAAVTVCFTNARSHVGTYKVKARVRGSADGIRARLAYQVGVSRYIENPYAPPLIGGIDQEIDLGTIIVSEAVLGTHVWSGRIDAYSPVTAGATLTIDYLLLIPQEHYGVARAPLVSVVPSTFAVLDNFLQTDGPLSGKGLEVPAQNWSTVAHTSPNGPSGDYAVVNSLDAVERVAIKDGWATTGNVTNGSLDITGIPSADVTRMRDANTFADPDTIYGAGIPSGAFVQSKLTTTSIRISGTAANATGTGVALTIGNPNYGRFALAGTTATYSAIQLQMTCEGRQTSGGLNNIPIDGKLRMGLLARYSDPNNWVACVRENYAVSAIEYSRLRVYKRVAGVTTMLGSKPEPGTRLGDRRTIILAIDGAGVWQAYSYAAGGRPPASPLISGQNDDLATGGLRAQGQVGLFDVFANPYVDNITRRYFNFSGFAASQDVVINASRNLEIRADRSERESSGGGVWGRVPEYRGDRFLVPASGDQRYVSRIAAKARRLNVDEGLADSFESGATTPSNPITVAVYLTPRFLHPPGAGTGRAG